MLFVCLFQQVDYEVELAFIIGKKGKDIPVSDSPVYITFLIFKLNCLWESLYVCVLVNMNFDLLVYC